MINLYHLCVFEENFGWNGFTISSSLFQSGSFHVKWTKAGHDPSHGKLKMDKTRGGQQLECMFESQ